MSIRKMSLLLVFTLVIQLIGFMPNVSANNQISIKGFSGDYNNSTGRNSLSVYGDDGNLYTLYANSKVTDLSSYVHQRIEFSGEFNSDVKEDSKVVNLASIKKININEDDSLESISSNGVVHSVLDDKFNHKVLIYNYEDKTGKTYPIVNVSQFTESSYFNEPILSDKYVSINGYLVKSTGSIVLNSIRLDSTKPVSPTNYILDIRSLKESNSNTKKYNFNLVSSSLSGSYVLVFDKTELKENFPTYDLVGKRISVNAFIRDNELIVTNWNIYSKDNPIQDSFNVLGVHFQNNDYITYKVTGYKNTTVKYLRFTKSVLGSKYPKDDLTGKDVNIVGKSILNGFTEINVSDFVVSVPEKTVTTEIVDLIEEKGKITKLLGSKKDQTSNALIEVDYMFKNFDGEEFLLHFSKNEGFPLPTLDLVGQNINFTGSKNGFNGTTPIIRIKSFILKDDSYTSYKNEIINVAGTVGKEIETDKNGQSIYSFTSKKGLYYNLVFDESVLKTSYPKGSLSGKSIDLYGLSTIYNNEQTIAVMSYRNINESKDNSTEIIGKDGVAYYTTGTIVTLTRIISESKNAIIYEGVNANGNKYTIQFSNSVLKSNMPKTYIVGDTVKLFGLYKTGNKNIVVYSWEVTNSNDSNTEKGTFGDKVKEYSNIVIYKFISVKGSEFEVSVSKSKFPNSMTGKKGIIYGQKTSLNSEEYVNLISFNELKNNSLINEKTASQISFQGTVKEIVSQNKNGITYYMSNQYEQFSLVYFDKYELEKKFPISSLLNKEIVVNGYIYDNGVIYVTSFNSKSISKNTPKINYLYEEYEYFPNMAGFTGFLSVLTVDTSHLILTTSSDTYLLEGKPSVIKKIENNLGKIVYLKGESSVVDTPYWSAKIKVYDIDVISNQTDVIIKPSGKPVPDMIRDPFKKAVHTIQNHYKPETFPYGDALIETTYIPKYEPIPSTQK